MNTEKYFKQMEAAANDAVTSILIKLDMTKVPETTVELMMAAWQDGYGAGTNNTLEGSNIVIAALAKEI